MAKLAIDNLLVEQEAAIDAIFRQMNDVIAKEMVVTAKGTIDVAKTMVGVDRQIALRFGGSRPQALASQIGSLIIDYSNTARITALRESLQTSIDLTSKEIVTGRIARDRTVFRAPDLGKLEVVTPNLIADAAPTGVIRAPRSFREAVGRGEGRTVVSASTRTASTLDAVLYREEAIVDLRANYAKKLNGETTGAWWEKRYEVGQPTMRAAIARDDIFRLKPESIDALRIDVLKHPSSVVDIVAQNRVPLALDDTTRWIDPKGFRLSDRLWEAGEDVRLAIEKRIRIGAARGESFERVARDLEQYLTADFKVKRTKRGTVAPSQNPGAITKNTFGRGKGSWPARRLARQELKRAHGEMLKAAARDHPDARCLKWFLSPKHADPDGCDENTRNSSPGRPTGVYDWDDTPEYPAHICCLCSLRLTDERGRSAK